MPNITSYPTHCKGSSGVLLPVVGFIKYLAHNLIQLVAMNKPVVDGENDLSNGNKKKASRVVYLKR